MKRLGFLLAVLALLLLPWASPAHADSEYLNHIDVTYDVQADGTVDVRYEINWHFPEKGRRGINLGFATREPWDQDATQDVVYEITDVRVSSPTGAPAQFTESTSGSGSRESLDLRIGDPEVTLDTQDATYVVEYTLAGALRTFDGAPQLYWDVNSPNLPELRKFTARVTGPDGVTRARCLLGAQECDSTVADGVATFSHDGGSGVTSVVAEFPPGSVANAEPVLEDRRVAGREMRGLDSHVEVQPDGSATVRQSLQVAFADDDADQRVELESYSRLPWDEKQDQVLAVEDLLVLDERGRSIPAEVIDNTRDSSVRLSPIRFEGGALGPEPEPLRTFEVSYVLRGAVGIDGDTARLQVPVVPMYTTHTTHASITWRLPGEPMGWQCRLVWTHRPGLGDPCYQFNTIVDGTTVTLDPSVVPMVLDNSVIALSFPAAAVASAQPLEESLDGARQARRNTGIGLGVGGGLAAVGIGAVASRVGRWRDQRYASVAPGLVGAPGAVRRASRRDIIPVQFHPPKLQPWEAGLLLDRQYRPQHLAATLVSLAVQGAVRLGTKPLTVQRISQVNVAHGLERRVLELASRGDGKLSDKRARSMRTAVVSGGNQRQRESGWFRADNAWLRALAEFFLPFAPLALMLGYLARYGNPLPNGIGFVLVGLFLGGIAARIVTNWLPGKPALTADGRAWLDQVEGFRQYLATAEAEQLNFEADRDIFRRYLPWAVLFNLTDRWTRVCRELAAQGRIDAPDTSFWVGAASFDTLGREMTSFSREVSSASRPAVSSSSSSSSGGSGGSSGFSSSSSGGGGGGGTSGSSW